MRFPSAMQMPCAWRSVRGVEIVPATGRMRSFLPAVHYVAPFYPLYCFPTVRPYMIGKKDRVVYENMMPAGLAERCFELVASYHVFSEVYVNGEAYTDRYMWERRNQNMVIRKERIAFMKNKRYHIVDDFRSFLRREDVKVEKYNMPYKPEAVFHEMMEFLESRRT